MAPNFCSQRLQLGAQPASQRRTQALGGDCYLLRAAADDGRMIEVAALGFIDRVAQDAPRLGLAKNLFVKLIHARCGDH